MSSAQRACTLTAAKSERATSQRRSRRASSTGYGLIGLGWRDLFPGVLLGLVLLILLFVVLPFVFGGLIHRGLSYVVVGMLLVVVLVRRLFGAQRLPDFRRSLRERGYRQVRGRALRAMEPEVIAAVLNLPARDELAVTPVFRDCDARAVREALEELARTRASRWYEFHHLALAKLAEERAAEAGE